jgi:hypothetical protein
MADETPLPSQAEASNAIDTIHLDDNADVRESLDAQKEKEYFHLKPELKESTEILYHEKYTPSWLITMLPAPFIAIPFMRYEVKLTACELTYGFNTAVTRMTVPVEDILHVKKVFMSPTMFYGWGVKYNGKHWGYIGGNAGFGIRIVVKPQGKGWLQYEHAGPQMIFFTCQDADKFIANFEKMAPGSKADTVVNSI